MKPWFAISTPSRQIVPYFIQFNACWNFPLNAANPFWQVSDGQPHITWNNASGPWSPVNFVWLQNVLVKLISNRVQYQTFPKVGIMRSPSTSCTAPLPNRLLTRFLSELQTKSISKLFGNAITWFSIAQNHSKAFNSSSASRPLVPFAEHSHYSATFWRDMNAKFASKKPFKSRLKLFCRE